MSGCRLALRRHPCGQSGTARRRYTADMRRWGQLRWTASPPFVALGVGTATRATPRPYELVQLRANMDRCIETFPVARFRDLMGVPPGKLLRGPDFTRFVIDPAVLEVNGISDMGVKLGLNRHNKTGAIEAVTVAWWRKEGDEFRAAMRERNRSKLGRMARLRGKVETMAPLASLG
jgi:Initiator Rep protein, WH2